MGTTSGTQPLVCLNVDYLDSDLFTPHEMKVVATLRRFADEDAWFRGDRKRR